MMSYIRRVLTIALIELFSIMIVGVSFTGIWNETSQIWQQIDPQQGVAITALIVACGHVALGFRDSVIKR